MSYMDIILASASIVAGGLVTFAVGYIKLRERVVRVETLLKDQTKTICELKESVDELNKQVACINDRITAQEVKTSLWWDSVKNTMIDILHHPNNFERDELLDKMKDNSISVSELEKLKNMLRRDSLNKDTKSEERAAAGMLYAVVVQYLFDCNKKGATKLIEC